jgi:2'-5' RNA ligase
VPVDVNAESRDDLRVIGVAVEVPEPWGKELQACREQFGGTRAGAIPTHVTLLPPTSIPRATLPEIEDHLCSVARQCRPFDMHLRGSGTFRPVSPVVFVQLAAGIGSCERVEQLVRSGPLARGLDFPYHPHITVAHQLPDPLLDEAFAALATYEARFPVLGFSLYEQAQGVWRPQRHYAFGGPPSP